MKKEKFYSSLNLQKDKAKASTKSFHNGCDCWLTECSGEDIAHGFNRAFRRFIPNYDDISNYKSRILILDFDGKANGKDIINDKKFARYDEMKKFLSKHNNCLDDIFSSIGVERIDLNRSSHTDENSNRFHLFVTLNHPYKFDNKTNGTINTDPSMLYGTDEFEKLKEQFAFHFITLSEPDECSLTRINQVIYGEFDEKYFKQFEKCNDSGKVNETSKRVVFATVGKSKSIKDKTVKDENHQNEIYIDKGEYCGRDGKPLMPFPRNASERHRSWGYLKDNRNHFGYLPLSVTKQPKKKHNGHQNRSKWCKKLAIKNTAVALFDLSVFKKQFNLFIGCGYDEDEMPFSPSVTLDNLWLKLFQQTVNGMTREISNYEEQESKYRKIIADTLDECLKDVKDFSFETFEKFFESQVCGYTVQKLLNFDSKPYSPKNKKDAVMKELLDKKYIVKKYDEDGIELERYEFAKRFEFSELRAKINDVLTKHRVSKSNTETANWKNFMRWSEVVVESTGELTRLKRSDEHRKQRFDKGAKYAELLSKYPVVNGSCVLPKNEITPAFRMFMSRQKIKVKTLRT